VNEGYDGFTSDETVLIRTEEPQVLRRLDLYGEIKAERERQDAKWGGAKHDDTHTNFDWIVYLTKHVGKAVSWPFDKSRFRTQMVRVAALAVAAIEWADRRKE
jgi:hypothetical protein